METTAFRATLDPMLIRPSRQVTLIVRRIE
jgi:hypothetical protein